MNTVLSQAFPEKNKNASFLGAFFFLGVLALYTLLTPFYVFSSGLPQPGDMVLLVGTLGMVFAVMMKPSMKLKKVYLAGAAFAGYTILINLIHCYFYFDPRFLLSSFYYIFNFLSFCFISYVFYHYPEKSKRYMRYALYIIIFVQFVILASHGYIRRAEGSFNNPNQFAYWALLAGINLFILNYKRRFNLLDFISYALIGYIQVHALSKAGLITYGLFLFITIFTHRIGNIGRGFLLFLAMIVSMYAVFNAEKFEVYASYSEAYSRVSSRLENIGQETDDSASARGYDRIINFPEYAIMGAGEGAYYRFHPRARNQELHSGVATLVFSYGLVGTLVFLWFLYQVFKNRPWYCFAFLITVTLYGLTHQNIRFTEYWVFLGLVNTIPRFSSKQRVQNSDPYTLPST